jgi:N,N'-diacetylchitobiose transport system permease protein
VIVLFGASKTLRLNGHVRVDLFYGALRPRGQVWLDLVCLAVKTDAKVIGMRGISLIIVETRNLPGYRVGRPLEKVGMHAQDTCELFFDGVEVPPERVRVSDAELSRARTGLDAGAESAVWNNFAHYQHIFTDERFWVILRNTVVVSLLMVLITMVLGTLVGLLMHRLPRWASATVGTALMLAWATPVISAAIVHRWLFDARYGLANTLLERIAPRRGWEEFNWFSDPVPLFSVLILTVVWQSFPFVAVTVLAGLKSIPPDLYEAARVDGAGPWHTFWSITWPILRPLFALLLILQVIWDFRIFTQLYILSGGFANRDVFLLPYYAYQLGFASTPPNYGLGSAIAVVMTAIVLAITAYYVRVMVRAGELSEEGAR